MAPKRPPAKIYPKISTLPRPRTEASHHLNLYRLASEKAQILQELEVIHQRRQRLHTRLAEIEQQISAQGGSQPAARDQTRAAHATSSSAPAPNVYLPEPTHQAPHDYDTVVLNY
ncbi:MAG: hypothetical protein ACFCVD_18865 [Nodosilinea sp.]